jgi:hypothetical protein
MRLTPGRALRRRRHRRRRCRFSLRSRRRGSSASSTPEKNGEKNDRFMRRHDIRHNDTQHNDIQHKNTYVIMKLIRTADKNVEA